MKKTLIAIGMLSAFAAMPVFAHDGDMMFNKIDTNGDGKISAEEHADYAQKKFEAADTNHDGYLTPAEFKAAQMKDHAKWSKNRTGNHLNDQTNPHPLKNSEANDTGEGVQNQ